MASSDVQLSNMTNWHARKHQYIAVQETFSAFFWKIIKKKWFQPILLFSKTKANDSSLPMQG